MSGGASTSGHGIVTRLKGDYAQTYLNMNTIITIQTRATSERNNDKCKEKSLQDILLECKVLCIECKVLCMLRGQTPPLAKPTTQVGVWA